MEKQKQQKTLGILRLQYPPFCIFIAKDYVIREVKQKICATYEFDGIREIAEIRVAKIFPKNQLSKKLQNVAFLTVGEFLAFDIPAKIMER